MAGSIGTAYLTLVPKLDAMLLAKEGENAGNMFGSSFTSKLNTAAKVGAAAMAATVAGIGLAAGAVKGAVEATAAYGDNVDKMSQKIGISAQSYQEWAYVMQRAGTDVNILQSGMKTLSTQAQQNAEEFQKLGISEQEVANLSKEDLFGRVVEGLSGMEDGTERTALATKLLGRSATELAPLLNQGTDAINEQREMAEKYGLVMSDSAVKASAAFEDSMTTLNGAVTGAKNALAGELLPSATMVSDGLTQLIVGNVDEGIELISSGIGTMLDSIASNLPSFLDNGSKIVLEMLRGLDNKMPDIVSGFVNLLVILIGQAPNYIPVIFSAAVQLFMGLVKAAPSVVGSLVSAIGQLIMNGVNAVGGYVGSFMSAGGDLIRGMVAGISPSALVNKIKEVCSNALDAVRSFFGIASPSKVMRKMFGYVGDGMVLGLEDSERDVSRAMDALMDSTYSSAADYGIGVNASMSAGRKTLNADVVGAIDTLHNDLYAIIKDATPDGITGRQFGRLVHRYA